MSIRWGVVGASGIADRRTIPEGILPASNAELVAVQSRNEQRAMELAAKYGGVRSYTNTSELYRDPEIDAVYIGLPNHLHAREVIKAAEAGKHILCEKPMAINLMECERMLEYCHDHRVKLGFGFMMRFHGHHRKLKTMLAAGELGTPVMARAQLTCWYPEIEGAWRQDPAQSGGGALMDMGSHCLDLLEFLLGPIREVSCVVECLAHEYLVEDTAVVLCSFESGCAGVVDSLFSIPDASAKNVLEVYGTRGSVIAEGTIGQDSTGSRMVARLSPDAGGYDAQQERTGGVVETEIPPEDEGNIYQLQIEAFSEAVDNDTEPPVGCQDGFHNMKVLTAAYHSAREGRAVPVD